MTGSRCVHRRLLLAVVTFAAFTQALQGTQSRLSMARFDLLFTNARVLDGTGNPWYLADVGIAGDRIQAVGRLTGAQAARVIDVPGLTLTPGFIDVHSHAVEWGLGTEALKHGRPLVAQGITTVVVNADGRGPTDLAAQRATLEKQGIGVNVGLMVPHGSVQAAVIGTPRRDPNPEQLATMAEIVRHGMEAGAFGLSSGYFGETKTAELVAMARVTAEFGGVYSSHIRDEGGNATVGVVAAVQEVITIAEDAGVTGVVTHMKALGPASHGLSMALITRIEAARARGVQVYSDQYPYTASGIFINQLVLSSALTSPGPGGSLKPLTAGEREQTLEAVRLRVQRRGGADTLLISRYGPDPSVEGRTLAELARKAGKPPEEYVLDLMQKSNGRVTSFNMSERDLELIMRQSWTMTSSDGGLRRGQSGGHPRDYGAFPRKLRLYVRERGVIDLPFAIRSMTSLPAQVFALKDRGQIRPGAIADILVFDPATVNDAASYDEPDRLAEGVTHIVINGVLVREAGTFSNALSGRVLRPERW